MPAVTPLIVCQTNSAQMRPSNAPSMYYRLSQYRSDNKSWQLFILVMNNSLTNTIFNNFCNNIFCTIISTNSNIMKNQKDNKCRTIVQ